MICGYPANLSHQQANGRPKYYWFFTFWPWGLTPQPKFIKRGNDLCYPPRITIIQILARSRKRSKRYELQKFFTSRPMGANPWAKVHQKARWPASHLGPAKFNCPTSPTPEISVTKYPADTQTHRHTNSKRYISSIPIGMRGIKSSSHVFKLYLHIPESTASLALVSHHPVNNTTDA